MAWTDQGVVWGLADAPCHVGCQDDLDHTAAEDFLGFSRPSCEEVELLLLHECQPGPDAVVL